MAHCPEPVYLVGAEVTDIPAMSAFGVPVGLGCDGAASNDNSNLMHCIHSAYMLQCLAPRHALILCQHQQTSSAMRPQAGRSFSAAPTSVGLHRAWPPIFFAIDTPPHGLCRHPT